MHLRFWGGGDVVVVLTQQLRICCAVIAGMCEDDGNRLIEEVESVQDLRKVWGAIDTAIRMGGDYGNVLFTITNQPCVCLLWSYTNIAKSRMVRVWFLSELEKPS